jgi:hypothetical protein
MEERMLKNEEVVVLAKSVSDKAFKDASKEVVPGRYSVDLVVRIHGDFLKSNPTEIKLSDKITVDWRLLAALALNKVNKETRDALVGEFLEAQDKPEMLIELTDEIKRGVAVKLEKVKKASAETRPVTGKITATLVSEVVGNAQIVCTGAAPDK